MPPNTIPIFPVNGFSRQKQSGVAFIWLQEEQERLNRVLGDEAPIIRHAGNSNEIKIGPYYLDGFAQISLEPFGDDKCKLIIYEFHGTTYLNLSTINLFSLTPIL